VLRTTFAGGGGMTQQTTHYFFGALDAAGLRDVQAEFGSRLIRGGSTESLFYTNSVRERGSMLVSAGLLTQEDMERTLAATVDPSVSWFTLGLVSAWGRRP
jgi:hypothetical protein